MYDGVQLFVSTVPYILLELYVFERCKLMCIAYTWYSIAYIVLSLLSRTYSYGLHERKMHEQKLRHILLHTAFT
jgi:hypothetical protein